MTTAVRRLLLSTLLLAAALGAVAHYAFGFFHLDQGGNAWGSDDAYTSYRYALNLASGHGLVFNPGERVEGYSNLLYVLVATVFAVVAPHAIYGCCVVLNIALWTATLIVFHRYLARTVGPGSALWGVAPLCLYPILWAWPASGLETSAVLLTQLLLFVYADLGSREPSRRATAAFVLLALTSILLRADGFVFPIICCLAFVVRRRRRQGAIALAAIVALAGVVIAARSWYYGSPLPNTYYAKVSGPLGQRLHSAGQDLSNAGVKDALFLYLIPLTLGWRPFFSAWKRRGVPDVSTLPLMPSVALGLLVYWFFIGGDVFYERFLLVLIPLGAAHFWGGSVDISTRWKRYATVAAVVLQLAPFCFDARFAYQLGKYDRWIDLGKLLALKHPGATLAIDAAGKVPFYSGLRTIDMLGLNDRHIARRPVVWFNVGHSKVDPDYVLAQRPDLVACWGSEWLDMEWGITRDRYEPRGYFLKYVVNASPRPKAANIIDVAGMKPAEVAVLYRQGYWYFVIMRGGVAAETRPH